VTDVAVVGGGLAGWTAARRASELGATVLLVERSRRRPGWGNSMISGGALHAALGSPAAAPEELLAKAVAVTDGQTDPQVARAWASNASRPVAWIASHGGQVVADGTAPHRAAVLAPVRRTEPGLRHAGQGVPRLLGELSSGFAAAGGRICQPGRARELSAHPAGWRLEIAAGTGPSGTGPSGTGPSGTGPSGTGPSGTGPSHALARAVVLADGGFQADPALLRRFVGTDRVRLRAAGTGTGDGLRMGMSVGAAAVQMRWFYGHLLAREAMRDGRLWPYPILDLLAGAGIVVGRNGRRIADEGHNGVTTANAVAGSDSPDGCWLVCDEAAWRADGSVGVCAPNPYLMQAGATVLRAPSIEALASEAGLDPAALSATAGEVLAGQGRPARTGTVKLQQPPFYAVPLIAGVTFTLGGLRADGRARVLGTDGAAIPGLYAAGGTMGGLHGGPRAGYVGGLLEAAVFGLLAGEDAAAFAAGEPAAPAGGTMHEPAAAR
jgi:fumarate reductase flavoprotein subunit